MSTLALCPSRGRPKAARETLASFERTRRDKGSRILFVVDDDDETRSDYPREHTLVVPATGTMSGALRSAAGDQKVLGDATSVGMIGDDNRFRTAGWDLILDGWLSTKVGVAYGNDGIQGPRLPTSWWVSRPLVDEFNMTPAGLRHLYMDNWWKSLGESAGFLRYFPEVSIEHLHPIKSHGGNWIKAAGIDDTYKRGNSHENAMNDRMWFQRWERRGKPGDVRTARHIASTSRRFRVFADWHHPALWESLSILFEDRFGWEIYSPVGTEWLDHGWQFAHNGTPAQGYLTFPGIKKHDGYSTRIEPEYPDRPRKLVTWDQASAMEWDYVLSSVPIHQRPFADLARAWGARAVHQVGNARHPIDRSVRQVILASSSTRHARDGVAYHQEFSRTMFPAGTQPADRASVASFMLRLETTSCDYSWIARADGIRFTSYGTKPYLTPMSCVAQRMGESGWIWHDKKIGDGYGHVLHNAAAMGRPLIGHASHYRGMAGEPFWDDLKTCIDLDKHDPTEAARLVRAISADPDWYADLSSRITRRFDELVDFDAEATKIREALA